MLNSSYVSFWVRSVRDADELIGAVEAMIVRRSAGATNKNAHSSRSHAIFTIGTQRSQCWIG